MRRLVPELALPTARYRVGGPRPTLGPPPDRAFRYGLDLWNADFPWEAHEVWEALWQRAVGVERRALGGLIQAAAARHARMEGRMKGCARLFERARESLDGIVGDDEICKVACQLRAALATHKASGVLQCKLDPDA